MIVEIPKFRRCCCCLPLRRGILTFAYVNLLVTIFFGVVHLLLYLVFYDRMKLQAAAGMYRGVVIEAHLFFIVALHVLDIVFNIVLIVGVHMKRSQLMRVYYYYQITTMIASFFTMFVTYRDIHQVSAWGAFSSLSEWAVAFIGFVIQIYLLLLIHSELNKQRYQEGRTSFSNQISEVVMEPPIRQDRRNFV